MSSSPNHQSMKRQCHSRACNAALFTTVAAMYTFSISNSHSVHRIQLKQDLKEFQVHVLQNPDHQA
jgi:hypothetical protein